jgi:hypothetical protein
MTFASYRKTQIKDLECKKFYKFWKDAIKRNPHNLLPDQSKNILRYCRKDLALLSKGCDLDIYYMIQFNMYT